MRLRIDDEIIALIDRALEEDLAGGVDVTSVATIDEKSLGQANFIVKAPGVVAGLDVAEAVMSRCGVSSFKRKVDDSVEVRQARSSQPPKDLYVPSSWLSELRSISSHE